MISIPRHIRRAMGDRLADGMVALRDLVAQDDANNSLLILDDVYPHMLSAFRIAEFNAYLEEFEGARVYSTGGAFKCVGEKRRFREVVREYEARYPQHQGRVQKYTPFRDFENGLVYTVFLNNAFGFIPVAERYGSAFVFTLYPGGGFRLWDEKSDTMLRRVFSSYSFRKVIVTQRISYHYLIDQELCPQDRIKFVYGVVLPSHQLSDSSQGKRLFRADKDTFDICFVANKYTPRGVDKGYDVFVEVAKVLSSICSDVTFHVVGPFDASDIDVSSFQDRICFYGTRYTDFFPNFYAGMDVILSPNRPFVLGPGSFDGFPTGACVEAGLCGVAVICTDPLQQNSEFEDGKEIVVVQPSVEEICENVLHLYHVPEALHAISKEGQQAFRRVFDLRTQLQPRLNLLRSLIGPSEREAL